MQFAKHYQPNRVAFYGISAWKPNKAFTSPRTAFLTHTANLAKVIASGAFRPQSLLGVIPCLVWKNSAENAGFEPARALCPYGFQNRRLKPLGQLSFERVSAIFWIVTRFLISLLRMWPEIVLPLIYKQKIGPFFLFPQCFPYRKCPASQIS